MWAHGLIVFFFSSRRRHTRLQGDWSSDVCSSDLMDDLGRLGGPPVGSQRARDDSDAGGVTQRCRQPAALLTTAASSSEIGRASCRGKSVDLGGRRIIKKKKRKESKEETEIAAAIS